MADKTNLISVTTILSFVCIIIVLMTLTACQTLQSPRCEIDYERIQQLQCYPIVSYQKWNECVSRCTNQPEVKSKPYQPENNPWIRPRPYAYP